MDGCKVGGEDGWMEKRMGGGGWMDGWMNE